jgi:soluble P-type ATPase
MKEESQNRVLVNGILIQNIILDMNGTLSVQGVIKESTKEIIHRLKGVGYKIVLFSGDVRGTAQDLCNDLNIDFKKAKDGNDKETYAKLFKKEETVAVGNSRIDIGTFKNSVLSIATLQPEGIHTDIIKYVDIICPSIDDALSLLFDQKSLDGTLKQ